MSGRKKIKVLVIDDSLVFRETLSRGLADDTGIEVVGTAADVFEARDKIIEWEPDVLTLDVEMPKMDGIEFLRRLMPQYPLPTVMLSSVSGKVFDALQAGAVDFVTKPSVGSQCTMESMIAELKVKIKIASTANLSRWKTGGSVQHQANRSRIGWDPQMIAIGASTGGTEATLDILRQLPADMPGIVIVQHMPPVFTKMYADRLNVSCRLKVKEAETGDPVVPGWALIAPGDRHMVVRKKGAGYVVECFPGDKINGHCPAVDVLFESVAKEAGRKALGIILTGMGKDGAKGLLSMRNCGARTFGQDESSSVVYGMPKEAFQIGAVERQIPLNRMAKEIYSIING
ncbi:chemotaxis response regulator protein-glutamate methylesterase [Paenibacillus tarimensis]